MSSHPESSGSQIEVFTVRYTCPKDRTGACTKHENLNPQQRIKILKHIPEDPQNGYRNAENIALYNAYREAPYCRTHGVIMTTEVEELSAVKQNT